MDSFPSQYRLSFENAFKSNTSMHNNNFTNLTPQKSSSNLHEINKKNTFSTAKPHKTLFLFEESKSPQKSKINRTKTTFRNQDILMNKYHINLANYIEDHKVDVKLTGTKRFSDKSGDYFLKNILLQKKTTSIQKILPKLSLKNPESLKSCIGKCKTTVKSLVSQAHKIVTKLPNNALTPIPIIEKTKIGSKCDSTALSNAKRYAVHIRRLEYSNDIKRNKNEKKEEMIKLGKIMIIQGWWKTIYAIKRIQRCFKGWNYRRKLYVFLESQELIIESLVSLKERFDHHHKRMFFQIVHHIPRANYYRNAWKRISLKHLKIKLIRWRQNVLKIKHEETVIKMQLENINQTQKIKTKEAHEEVNTNLGNQELNQKNNNEEQTIKLCKIELSKNQNEYTNLTETQRQNELKINKDQLWEKGEYKNIVETQKQNELKTNENDTKNDDLKEILEKPKYNTQEINQANKKRSLNERNEEEKKHFEESKINDECDNNNDEKRKYEKFQSNQPIIEKNLANYHTISNMFFFQLNDKDNNRNSDDKCNQSFDQPSIQDRLISFQNENINLQDKYALCKKFTVWKYKTIVKYAVILKALLQLKKNKKDNVSIALNNLINVLREKLKKNIVQIVSYENQTKKIDQSNNKQFIVCRFKGRSLSHDQISKIKVEVQSSLRRWSERTLPRVLSNLSNKIQRLEKVFQKHWLKGFIHHTRLMNNKDPIKVNILSTIFKGTHQEQTSGNSIMNPIQDIEKSQSNILENQEMSLYSNNLVMSNNDQDNSIVESKLNLEFNTIKSSCLKDEHNDRELSENNNDKGLSKPTISGMIVENLNTQSILNKDICRYKHKDNEQVQREDDQTSKFKRDNDLIKESTLEEKLDINDPKHNQSKEKNMMPIENSSDRINKYIQIQQNNQGNEEKINEHEEDINYSTNTHFIVLTQNERLENEIIKGDNQETINNNEALDKNVINSRKDIKIIQEEGLYQSSNIVQGKDQIEKKTIVKKDSITEEVNENNKDNNQEILSHTIYNTINNEPSQYQNNQENENKEKCFDELNNVEANITIENENNNKRKNSLKDNINLDLNSNKEDNDKTKFSIDKKQTIEKENQSSLSQNLGDPIGIEKHQEKEENAYEQLIVIKEENDIKEFNAHSQNTILSKNFIEQRQDSSDFPNKKYDENQNQKREQQKDGDLQRFIEKESIERVNKKQDSNSDSTHDNIFHLEEFQQEDIANKDNQEHKYQEDNNQDIITKDNQRENYQEDRENNTNPQEYLESNKNTFEPQEDSSLNSNDFNKNNENYKQKRDMNQNNISQNIKNEQEIALHKDVTKDHIKGKTLSNSIEEGNNSERKHSEKRIIKYEKNNENDKTLKDDQDSAEQHQSYLLQNYANLRQMQENMKQDQDNLRQLQDNLRQLQEQMKVDQDIMKQEQDNIKQDRDIMNQMQEKMKEDQNQIIKVQENIKQIQQNIKHDQDDIEQVQSNFKQLQENFKQDQESFKQNQESFKQNQESFMQNQENFKQDQENFKQDQANLKQSQEQKRQDYIDESLKDNNQHQRESNQQQQKNFIKQDQQEMHIKQTNEYDPSQDERIMKYIPQDTFLNKYNKKESVIDEAQEKCNDQLFSDIKICSSKQEKSDPDKSLASSLVIETIIKKEQNEDINLIEKNTKNQMKNLNNQGSNEHLNETFSIEKSNSNKDINPTLSKSLDTNIFYSQASTGLNFQNKENGKIAEKNNEEILISDHCSNKQLLLIKEENSNELNSKGKENIAAIESNDPYQQSLLTRIHIKNKVFNQSDTLIKAIEKEEENIDNKKVLSKTIIKTNKLTKQNDYLNNYSQADKNTEKTEGRMLNDTFTFNNSKKNKDNITNKDQLIFKSQEDLLKQNKNIIMPLANIKVNSKDEQKENIMPIEKTMNDSDLVKQTSPLVSQDINDNCSTDKYTTERGNATYANKSNISKIEQKIKRESGFIQFNNSNQEYLTQKTYQFKSNRLKDFMAFEQTPILSNNNIQRKYSYSDLHKCKLPYDLILSKDNSSRKNNGNLNQKNNYIEGQSLREIQKDSDIMKSGNQRVKNNNATHKEIFLEHQESKDVASLIKPVLNNNEDIKQENIIIKSDIRKKNLALIEEQAQIQDNCSIINRTSKIIKSNIDDNNLSIEKNKETKRFDQKDNQSSSDIEDQNSIAVKSNTSTKRKDDLMQFQKRNNDSIINEQNSQKNKNTELIQTDNENQTNENMNNQSKENEDDQIDSNVYQKIIFSNIEDNQSQSQNKFTLGLNEKEIDHTKSPNLNKGENIIQSQDDELKVDLMDKRQDAIYGNNNEISNLKEIKLKDSNILKSNHPSNNVDDDKEMQSYHTYKITGTIITSDNFEDQNYNNLARKEQISQKERTNLYNEDQTQMKIEEWKDKNVAIGKLNDEEIIQQSKINENINESQQDDIINKSSSINRAKVMHLPLNNEESGLNISIKDQQFLEKNDLDLLEFTNNRQSQISDNTLNFENQTQMNNHNLILDKPQENNNSSRFDNEAQINNNSSIINDLTAVNKKTSFQDDISQLNYEKSNFEKCQVNDEKSIIKKSQVNDENSTFHNQSQIPTEKLTIENKSKEHGGQLAQVNTDKFNSNYNQSTSEKSSIEKTQINDNQLAFENQSQVNNDKSNYQNKSQIIDIKSTSDHQLNSKNQSDINDAILSHNDKMMNINNQASLANHLPINLDNESNSDESLNIMNQSEVIDQKSNIIDKALVSDIQFSFENQSQTKDKKLSLSNQSQVKDNTIHLNEQSQVKDNTQQETNQSQIKEDNKLTVINQAQLKDNTIYFNDQSQVKESTGNIDSQLQLKDDTVHLNNESQSKDNTENLNNQTKDNTSQFNKQPQEKDNTLKLLFNESKDEEKDNKSILNGKSKIKENFTNLNEHLLIKDDALLINNETNLKDDEDIMNLHKKSEVNYTISSNDQNDIDEKSEIKDVNNNNSSNYQQIPIISKSPCKNIVIEIEDNDYNLPFKKTDVKIKSQINQDLTLRNQTTVERKCLEKYDNQKQSSSVIIKELIPHYQENIETIIDEDKEIRKVNQNDQLPLDEEKESLSISSKTNPSEDEKDQIKGINESLRKIDCNNKSLINEEDQSKINQNALNRSFNREEDKRIQSQYNQNESKLNVSFGDLQHTDINAEKNKQISIINHENDSEKFKKNSDELLLNKEIEYKDNQSSNIIDERKMEIINNDELSSKDRIKEKLSQVNDKTFSLKKDLNKIQSQDRNEEASLNKIQSLDNSKKTNLIENNNALKFSNESNNKNTSLNQKERTLIESQNDNVEVKSIDNDKIYSMKKIQLDNLEKRDIEFNANVKIDTGIDQSNINLFSNKDEVNVDQINMNESSNNTQSKTSKSINSIVLPIEISNKPKLSIKEKYPCQTPTQVNTISHLDKIILERINFLFKTIINNKTKALNDAIVKYLIINHPAILKCAFNKWRRIPIQCKDFMSQLYQIKAFFIKSAKISNRNISLFSAFNQWKIFSHTIYQCPIQGKQHIKILFDKENSLLRNICNSLIKAKTFANTAIRSQINLFSKAKNAFEQWNQRTSTQGIIFKLKAFRIKYQFLNLYIFKYYQSTKSNDALRCYFFKWKQVYPNMLYSAYMINRKIQKAFIEPKIIRRYNSIATTLLHNAFKKWKQEAYIISNISSKSYRYLSLNHLTISTLANNFQLIKHYSKYCSVLNEKNAQVVLLKNRHRTQSFSRLYLMKNKMRLHLLRSCFFYWNNYKLNKKNVLRATQKNKSSMIILQQIKGSLYKGLRTYFIKWIKTTLEPIKEQLMINTVLGYKKTKQNNTKGQDILCKLLRKRKMMQWRKINKTLNIIERKVVKGNLNIKGKYLSRWRIKVIKHHYNHIRVILINNRRFHILFKKAFSIYNSTNIKPYFKRWSHDKKTKNQREICLNHILTKNNILFNLERAFNIIRKKTFWSNRRYLMKQLNSKLIMQRRVILSPKLLIKRFFNKVRILNQRNELLRQSIQGINHSIILSYLLKWNNKSNNLRAILTFRCLSESYIKHNLLSNLKLIGRNIFERSKAKVVDIINEQEPSQKLKGSNMHKTHRAKLLFDKVYHNKTYHFIYHRKLKNVLPNKKTLTNFVKLLERTTKYKAIKQLRYYSLKNTILKSTTLILGALSKYPFSVLIDYLKSLNNRGYNKNLSSDSKQCASYLENITRLKNQIHKGKCIDDHNINLSCKNQRDNTNRHTLNDNHSYLYDNYHNWFSLVNPINSGFATERIRANNNNELFKGNWIKPLKQTHILFNKSKSPSNNIRPCQSLKSYSKYLLEVSGKLDSYRSNNMIKIPINTQLFPFHGKSLSTHHNNNVYTILSAESFGITCYSTLFTKDKIIKVARKRMLMNLRKLGRQYKQYSNLCFLIKITFLHRSSPFLSFFKAIIKRWKQSVIVSKKNKTSIDLLYKNMNILYQKDVDEIFSENESSYTSQIKESLNSLIQHISQVPTVIIAPSKVISTSLKFSKK